MEKSKLGKKVVHSQGREIVYNVYNFFKERDVLLTSLHCEKQSSDKCCNEDILKTVSLATGVAITTVRRIVNEGETLQRENSIFVTPGKSRPNKKKKVNIDDFDKTAIRRMIHNFHITNEQRPTLKMLHEKVKEDLNFMGSRESLRKIILSLGFKWVKAKDNIKVLMEKSDVLMLRANFIRQITRYRSEGRPIIYTDETYINACHTSSKAWSDSSSQGLKVPTGKGERLIIVHAGGESGFVNNGLLIYQGNLKSGDYHNEMNYINYHRYITTQLVPNLPPRSVVVMDNASYHNVLKNKAPTSTSKKQDMKDWLSEKNIPFSDDLLKVELYNLIKLYKSRDKEYKIDDIFNEHSHVVLRLPPYHPDLNAIEKIWAQVKDDVAKRNVTFKINDIKSLALKKFNEIGVEQWSKVCEHVKALEKHYFEHDVCFEREVEKLVINVDSDCDSQLTIDSENSISEEDLGCSHLPI